MTEFQEVYDLYFKDVYLFAYSLTKDKHLAEDITSETFIRALNSLDSFKGDSHIRVWLCQIAKNYYFSYLKKNKRILPTELLSEEKADINIESMIIASEEAMKVHTILHRLKEPYKEVFSLRVFGELSFKDIGHIFGKTDNWACVTYHRARNKIRNELEGSK